MSARAELGPAEISETRRQKTRQRKEVEILRAAKEAFSEKGFEGTRMADVAARADVSEGTLYGYFGTKENLLLSLVKMQRAESDARIQAAVDNPPNDLRAAVIRFMRSVLDSVTEHLDPGLWRQVYAAWLLKGGAPVGQASSDIEQRLVAQLRQLLYRLEAGGAIRAGVDVDDLAEILHSINLFHWIQFLVEEHPTVADMQRALERQIATLCVLFGTA